MNKKFNSLKKGALLCGFFLLFVACKKNTATYTASTTQNISGLYYSQLTACIDACKQIKPNTPKDSLIQQFKMARLRFKNLEPLMGFFNAATYKSLNRPNLPIVDEDDNAEKVLQPTGFQVLEEYVTADSIPINLIKEHQRNIINILNLEQNNFTFSHVKNHHIMWMVRDTYLRVLSLGVSGFDSPIIQYSIPENKAVFTTLIQVFTLYKNRYKDQQLYNEQLKALQNAQKAFVGQDFNTFDRYSFIKNHIHPLLDLLNKTQKDWKIQFPFSRKLNSNANSFFDATTFNNQHFSASHDTLSEEVIALGKELFFDPSLSGNHQMSCFSCHQPDKAFTDGLQFSKARDGGHVTRNSPTLLYSGIQAAQFYDARAASLETQIIGVIENDKEFHNNIETILNTLKSDENYVSSFKNHYNDGLTSDNFRHAIASFVRTLSPFNSKFDRNITGKDESLTTAEIAGFNLFMGKAKCATCHFAPVFNGTVPPTFEESELEVLGVPKTIAWENATIDDDLGRYGIFETPKKKFAFKTPTIRNSSKTAPYMHNGIYNTLNEVIKFYNLGGGNGIGIKLKNQTLPPDPLNLTTTEIQNLITFLNTLEDANKETFR